MSKKLSEIIKNKMTKEEISDFLEKSNYFKGIKIDGLKLYQLFYTGLEEYYDFGDAYYETCILADKFTQSELNEVVKLEEFSTKFN